jgi:hypothetical protein
MASKQSRQANDGPSTSRVVALRDKLDTAMLTASPYPRHNFEVLSRAAMLDRSLPPMSSFYAAAHCKLRDKDNAKDFTRLLLPSFIHHS